MIEASDETKSMTPPRRQAFRFAMGLALGVCALQFVVVICSLWQQNARHAEIRKLEAQLKVLEVEIAKLRPVPPGK